MINNLPLAVSADGAGVLGRFIFELVPRLAVQQAPFVRRVCRLASRVAEVIGWAKTWQVFVECLYPARMG